MVERPLLIFPGKADASRSSKGGGPTAYNLPSSARQGQRLTLKFTQLQNALHQRAIELQQTAAGIEPEQALVIETIGSVENFINTVKLIDGFEWLEEIEIDEIAPDEDFYDKKSKDNPLEGRLYIVMSNAKAMDELLSMWNRWLRDSTVKFERGLNRFREIFSRLKDIRRWNVEDRLTETGVIEAWQEDLQYEGQRGVKFEIELWFRNSEAKRAESARQVNNLITDLQGEVKQQCIIQEIAYHSILAELPANAIQQIIDHPYTALVECEGVMFFRAVGQIASDSIVMEEIPQSSILSDFPLPTGVPIVGILDGLPVSNHDFLSGRVIVDDPDDWLSQYKLNELRHGTAMISLIIHGDLSHNDRPLSTPVYVRPIMKPNPTDFNDCREESVPDTAIVVDLLHRAIKRIFEGDGEEVAIAPSIRVISLSVCDKKRHFNYSMSPWARLLDWLSVKYNVLFIVSAGNHPHPLELNISNEEKISDLNAENKRKKIVKSLYQDARHRRLLSPAESINCLTVGSAHTDGCETFSSFNNFDPFDQLLPSPLSPFGSGYRKSIKPDLIFPGGRQLYRESMISHNKIEPVTTSSYPPGNKVAYPGTQVGELDRTIHCRGTSNSAALLTRAAAICYGTLIDILNNDLPGFEYRKYEIPLLKAMLIHGCSWEEIANIIGESFPEIDGKRQLQKLVCRWLGYGIPDITRVLKCTEQRATILGFGELSNDEAHVFDLPLPSSLESKREWRRVTITMAYNSPTIPTNQKYRQAGLWFQLLDDNLVNSPIDAQWQAVRRGTVQHQIFEGERAVSFPDNGTLKIKINCTKDAGKIEYPIPYGIIVSLEVREGVNIQIYQEIKTHITPKVKID
jgi:hypothetical protein